MILIFKGFDFVTRNLPNMLHVLFHFLVMIINEKANKETMQIISEAIREVCAQYCAVKMMMMIIWETKQMTTIHLLWCLFPAVYKVCQFDYEGRDSWSRHLQAIARHEVVSCRREYLDSVLLDEIAEWDHFVQRHPTVTELGIKEKKTGVKGSHQSQVSVDTTEDTTSNVIWSWINYIDWLRLRRR